MDELLELHKDAVNACVSWKLGEITQDDAAKVEAKFRAALARRIEPREKRELRLIKDCEELMEMLQEAEAVATPHRRTV